MGCRIVRRLTPTAASVALVSLLLGIGGCSGMLRWDGASASGRHHAAKPVRSSESRAATADEYRVQAGDTLYAIAFRNQLDYHDLARWNGIGSDYRINPGQVLKLRASAGSVTRPTTPSDTVVIKPPAASTPRQPVASAVGSASDRAPPPEVGDAPQGFEWLWPTTGTILRTYAPQQGFKGLDFGGNLGQPVFAAAPGRVVYSGNALKGYGELIIIKHNDSYLSAYGYNRRRNVKEGDVVTAGQPIAELGLGPENKPFLHFEIRERGQPVDPMRFLPRRETTPGAK